MKNTLDNIWTNCKSAGYTALTLIGILLVVVGSFFALPIILGLLIPGVIFMVYKLIISDDDPEEDPDVMYRHPRPVFRRYKNDD